MPHSIQVRFRRPDCAACPVRSQCTHSPAQARVLTLRPQPLYEALAKGRARQHTQEFKQRYALRAGVESSLSQGIRVFGLREDRYMGLTKTRLQHIVTAAAMNLSRMWAFWRNIPIGLTRVSRFSALFPSASSEFFSMIMGCLVSPFFNSPTVSFNRRVLIFEPMPKYLTIKELTQAVKGTITPRMVRHYHSLGLLSPAVRSTSNYRLYTRSDVQKLQKIVALKQQGFQLSHIRKLLQTDADASPDALMATLQQQYLSVTQQIVRLRQTALALEGLLGRDISCQAVQGEALAQMRLLQVETEGGLEELEQVWDSWDVAAHSHPEAFGESLQHLLPDLSDRSEIEVDLLSKLVLACGDCSLLPFVKLSKTAIKSAREALKNRCQIVADVSPVFAALDRTRLAHLGTSIVTLIDDPHINDAAEAEQEFWQERAWFQRLLKLEPGCILAIGYAPSVLIAVCEAIESGQLQPALVIGMPIGFSHSPIAKRRLVRSGVPFITTVGTFGGGLLAAVALNALVESLIEKPNCHCHLK